MNESAFYRFLRFWAKEHAGPLVLFIDEIDGLSDDTLIPLLKQLRTGHTKRPELFPQSVCLVSRGTLQKRQIEENRELLFSPFNIIADTIVLRNLTQEQVQNLYAQHTQETGQAFTDESIEYAYYLTQGQPRLINALAHQACFKDVIDRSITITKEIIDRAKEQLILQQAIHINSLLEREDRIRLIAAIARGDLRGKLLNGDDLDYVRDLGFVKPDSLEIANPLYNESIIRKLAGR